MHVEALNWRGSCATHYANAHNISVVSLRRWLGLLGRGDVEIDWRAYLRPSARAKISSGASSPAKKEATEKVLAEAPKSDPKKDRQANRRSFTDEEKIVILLEAKQQGVSVAAICRHHDIVTSMVFRWRVHFGFGEKERAELVAVRVGDGSSGCLPEPLVLHDLLPPPDGMTEVQLADGRRVFAPKGSDPEAELRHILEQEAAR